MIASFDGEYRFLSNFWMCPVTYEGLTYPSAEHAYQAAKSNRPDIREAFADIKTAGLVKKLGQQIDIRSDWECVKINIMRRIVEAKFEQNPDLMEKLLATKPHELIEGNWWGDRFWGKDELGQGRNELGKILMAIRDDITRITE